VARPTPRLRALVSDRLVRCDRVERAGQGHGVHRETVERCEYPPKPKPTVGGTGGWPLVNPKGSDYPVRKSSIKCTTPLTRIASLPTQQNRRHSGATVTAVYHREAKGDALRDMILIQRDLGHLESMPFDNGKRTAAKLKSNLSGFQPAPDARQPWLSFARHASRAVIVAQLEEPGH
jgi:hypothetical protein